MMLNREGAIHSEKCLAIFDALLFMQEIIVAFALVDKPPLKLQKIFTQQLHQRPGQGKVLSKVRPRPLVRQEFLRGQSILRGAADIHGKAVQGLRLDLADAPTLPDSRAKVVPAPAAKQIGMSVIGVITDRNAYVLPGSFQTGQLAGFAVPVIPKQKALSTWGNLSSR